MGSDDPHQTWLIDGWFVARGSGYWRYVRYLLHFENVLLLKYEWGNTEKIWKLTEQRELVVKRIASASGIEVVKIPPLIALGTVDF